MCAGYKEVQEDAQPTECADELEDYVCDVYKSSGDCAKSAIWGWENACLSCAPGTWLRMMSKTIVDLTKKAPNRGSARQ